MPAQPARTAVPPGDGENAASRRDGNQSWRWRDLYRGTCSRRARVRQAQNEYGLAPLRLRGLAKVQLRPSSWRWPWLLSCRSRAPRAEVRAAAAVVAEEKVAAVRRGRNRDVCADGPGRIEHDVAVLLTVEVRPIGPGARRRVVGRREGAGAAGGRDRERCSDPSVVAGAVEPVDMNILLRP